MELSFTIYSVSLLAAGIVAGFTTAATILRSDAAVRTFSIMMALVAVWAIAYGMELSVRTLEEMMFWIRIEYIGIALIPAFWLLFCIQFAGYDSVLNRRALPLLFVLPLMTLLIVWSNDWHHLHYREVSVAETNGLYLLNIEMGPWYLFHLVLFYLYLLAGVILLIRKYLSTNLIIRRQLLIILFAAAIPWSANLLYILGPRPFGHLDITPYAFVVSGLFISIGLMRFKLFEFLPVAREKIIEEMNEGVLILDEELQVLDTNPAMHKILARERDDVTGESILTLFWGEQKLLSLMRSEEEGRIEYQMQNGQKVLTFEVSTKPSFNRKGEIKGLTVLFRDVTEQKESEAEIIYAREQAEAASRSKSDFLAHMSHEIRTPLNAIIGFADLIMKTDLKDTQRRYLSTVQSSSRYLLDIVNDILDLSRIEAGKLELNPEEINPQEFCTHIANLFFWQADTKGIEFVVELDPKLPASIQVDEMKLQQVLTNLLGNAFKFTEQGKIRFQVEHCVKADDGTECVRFSIQDTGIGIALENQKKIFESFTQEDISTKKKFSGTGLGLTIASQLLGLMGSDLQLESNQGVGSTFWFELPIIKKGVSESCIENGTVERTAKAGKSDNWIHKTHPDKFKILIVEDNKVNNLLMRSIISRYFPKATILDALDGKKAIGVVRTESPDLIFMDVQMPVMSGYESSEQIRIVEQDRRTPIIALTAATSDQVRERCYNAGMNDYLSKPVLPGEIEQMILKWIRNRPLN